MIDADLTDIRALRSGRNYHLSSGGRQRSVARQHAGRRRRHRDIEGANDTVCARGQPSKALCAWKTGRGPDFPALQQIERKKSVRGRYLYTLIGLLLAALPPNGASADVSLRKAPRTAGRGNEGAAMKINVQIGDGNFAVKLEENAAADAQATPLTVETRDYGGFEKVGALEAVLPAEGRQTAARSSDIALYQGEQIVVFYGSNLWKYTRRGRTDALVGMEEALGDGGIAMTFSQREERRLAEWRGASAALRSPNARASFTSASFLFVITFVEEIEGVHTTIQLIIEEW